MTCESEPMIGGGSNCLSPSGLDAMSASDMTISVMPYTVITDVDATPVVLSLALRVDGEATYSGLRTSLGA